MLVQLLQKFWLWCSVRYCAPFVSAFSQAGREREGEIFGVSFFFSFLMHDSVAGNSGWSGEYLEQESTE